MSAINFLTMPDRIHVIADVAGYYSDGTIADFRSKIHFADDFRGVICTTGATHVGAAIRRALDRAASFDELLEAAPVRLAQYASGYDIALAVGGYSESRGEFESWFWFSGQYNEFPAGKLPPYSGQPAMTCKQWAQGFNTSFTQPQQIVDIDDFARTLLSMQREVTWGREDGFPDDSHLVGGWGELATLTKDSANVRRVIKWPEDQIGQRIRPTAIDWAEWRRTHARLRHPRAVVLEAA